MTRFESIDWYDIVFDAGTAAKWFTNDRNRFSYGIAVTFLAMSAREEW